MNLQATIEPANQSSLPIILDPRAPLLSARAFVDHHYTELGIRALHHHNGEFFAWTGTHYPAADEAEIKADLYQFLDSAQRLKPDGDVVPFNPNRSKVGDVLDALKAACNLSGTVRAPAWLEETADLAADEIISCTNGLLHLPDGLLVPHTPALFIQNAVDFAYRDAAPPPQEWLNFLAGLWPDDPEAIATLQQIFGYLLTGDTRQQKAFLVVGPKRSGKGTIARVLTRLLGQSNVVSPTLTGLGHNFGLEPLIGKRLAIISDARLGSGPRVDQHAITERVLAITGEDGLTIDRKFKPGWTGRLQTRFLILTNELPRLTDASGALASRFIVLTMENSFFGKEDRGLTDRLLLELPGILNWAIEGWKKLGEQGYFSQPTSSQEAIQELEDLGSPISLFLREKCVVEQGKTVGSVQLFESWRGWCEAQGRDHPGTAQSFGRDLRSAIPGLKITQRRGLDGERLRYYEGVGVQ